MRLTEIDALLDEHGEPIPGAPLGSLLTAQARRQPDAPALTIGGETITRASLDASANRRARWFESMDVGCEDTVVIALPNVRAFYESVLACWKLGAIPAPVSWRLTRNEYADILSLAAPRLVVSDVEHIGPELCVISGLSSPPPDIRDHPLEPIAATSWKMATTGGSTGKPKLVIDAAPGVWGPEKMAMSRRSGMAVINPSPLYHAAPFGLIIPAILQGCHVIEMGSFDARQWLRLVSSLRVEWAYMVPTMMSRIAKLPSDELEGYDLCSLTTLLHLAAPCPEWVKRFWIEKLGPDAIWEIYGGAERLGATMIGGREWLEHPGSVGRANETTSIEIRSEDGSIMPAGNVGEIFLRRTSPGSHLKTEEGQIAQGGDWASFGDLGYMDDDGYLYLVDRRTDMIISGGVNIYPSEIETALGSHPKVIGAVVVGLPDEDLGKRAHVILQCAPTDLGKLDEEELRAHLASRLAKPKHPRSFEFTARPIRDDAGKVRRSAWRDEIIARSGHPASEVGRTP